MNLILRERENFLDNFFKPFWGEQEFYKYNVPTDIKETSSSYIVKADLPGLEEKDIKVEYQDGILSISGERKSEQEDKQDNYYRSEISYGKFSRSFRFGNSVNDKDIKAKFKNGVLEVTLHKAEAKKPRLIPLH